jgi:hypothetical protein
MVKRSFHDWHPLWRMTEWFSTISRVVGVAVFLLFMGVLLFGAGGLVLDGGGPGGTYYPAHGLANGVFITGLISTGCGVVILLIRSICRLWIRIMKRRRH